MRTEPLSLNIEVKALLVAANLPVSDLSSSRDLHLLGMRENGTLIGVVGVEVYGSVGLLRSLAVAPARRYSGLGVGLVAGAETWAAEHGIKALYLLTTNARSFFAKLDYKVCLRSEAPAAIAATAQFKGLCPDSSVCMQKVLAAADPVQSRRACLPDRDEA